MLHDVHLSGSEPLVQPVILISFHALSEVEVDRFDYVGHADLDAEIKEARESAIVKFYDCVFRCKMEAGVLDWDAWEEFAWDFVPFVDCWVKVGVEAYGHVMETDV